MMPPATKILQHVTDSHKALGVVFFLDELKILLNKCKWPEKSVGVIRGTKFNPEKWTQLNPSKQKIDLQLSNMQQIVQVTFVTPKTTRKSQLEHTVCGCYCLVGPCEHPLGATPERKDQACFKAGIL